jgi:glutamate 5-kinase
MPVAILKLGSSVVADDSGELRLSVVARLCEEVAALHRAGTDVVVVTSGAIARGMRLLDLPVRPTGIEALQAASAVGQGRLYRTYDELLRELGIQSAQVLLTFFDMSARTHYLNGRDLLRRQRLPGRAGRGAGRGVAAVAADGHRGAVHRRPAAGPGRAAGLLRR